MNEPATLVEGRRALALRLPFYYGWINVVMAAAAMSATLPGRTHGLGLITEPMLAELGIGLPLFADINLACTLLGAAFCLPFGWVIDRFGVRRVVTCVLFALAASVWAMSRATGPASLFATLLMVRGLGQSALSVTSIAIIGKWFQRRLGPAMGVFAVLLTFGFIAAILAVDGLVKSSGWRGAWVWVAGSLACFAPIAWLCVRSTPESCGLRGDQEEGDQTPIDRVEIAEPGFTLLAALLSPAFWVFALGTAAFNLVWTAITLFNQAILAERGFDTDDTAATVMVILTGCGLVSNLVSGALARRDRLGRMLAIGLTILAGGLFLYPRVVAPWQLYCYALAIGLAGGVVTVIFFTAWSHLFGRANVGKILGAAQVLTVCASALGPVVMARTQSLWGTFSPAFYALAASAALLAFGALVVRLPDLGRPTQE